MAGMQETEPFHILSPSDWPSQTPASRRLLAQGWRMISSSRLAQPSRLILSARAVNVVLFNPPPWEAVLCFDGLFLFLEKCSSVTTTETAGLLLQDKWSEEWLREERDQSCGCKPFCKAMTGSRMLAVLPVTGVGFHKCLLASETSLVNPISKWESAAHQKSELISARETS